MKILVVQTGFFGDVVLSTPVFRNLKIRFPEAELFVLTTPHSASLVRFHPDVDEVLSYDKRGKDSSLFGLFRMSSALRRRKFDMVFSLHKSYRTALLLWLAGIPKRYGFDEAKARRLYTACASRKGFPHEVLRNLAILQNIGISPEETEQKMQIGIPADALREADELLSRFSLRKCIGVAPGSVWATKRWTVEGFSEVVRALDSQGFSVVLIGGKNDLDAAIKIEQLSGVAVLNLVGRAKFMLSAAVISRLEILVTNDSAPLHIASACGTPVVAVFCATVPEFGFGPWKVPSETVGVQGLACRPCARHGGQHCPTGTNACQLQLSPLAVLHAVKRVLAQSEEGRPAKSIESANERIGEKKKRLKELR